MHLQQRPSLGWGEVAIATVLMVLISGLILYPSLTDANILTALRVSSLITALPFLLVFSAKPLVQLNVMSSLGRWSERNSGTLWLILTISHLLHLYQIGLYYRLGQSCPWTVWVMTAPLWVLMLIWSGVEIFQPQVFTQLYRSQRSKQWNLFYGVASWYIWFVFAVAFGLGTVMQHILFYNLPAFGLFVAAAIAQGLTRWQSMRH
jgi:hypothetical protein